MGYQNVIIEKHGPVAVLKVNRPEALNALNEQVLRELTEAVSDLETDRSISVVVFTGEGKSFIAGADIKLMVNLTPLEAKVFAENGHNLLNRIEASRLPYIAAVNGYALGGGCEVMMACDMVIASTKAKIGQPEINLGISPGFGGTQRLTRHIGRMRAKELLLTGDSISAQEAYELGLVNRVVQPEALMDAAMELANKIAEKSDVQISFIKALVNKGADIDLTTANYLEISYFSSSFSTHDQKEGMNAFIEKRKPEFTDN
ncbi:MAG: enoyl-CoA hydratase/isomerase family protein [Candidatus Thermoplasmatota archaeon]|nr:enoyl-CoA hydratase/isomerase family protein [Candidatus Thermoplasmatota archaeon]